MTKRKAPQPLWQPTERAIEEAQVTQFAKQVIRKRGHVDVSVVL